MNNNDNKHVIITLCSYLCINGLSTFKPLSCKEYSILADKLYSNNYMPKDILNFTDNDFKTILNYDQEQIDRIKNLLTRSASLTFEIEKLNKIGIQIVTRACSEYPRKLKQQLKHKCPPLFYYCGDLNLLSFNYTGIVGSRNIDQESIDFTNKVVEDVYKKNEGVVSGGAKGVDSTSAQKMLQLGGNVVLFISDSLNKVIKDEINLKYILSKKLLILSQVIPTARFNTGVAMERNKYIYAQSKNTVVIKSDYNKGGTWAGAKESFNNNYTDIYCWNNDKYPGNIALIKMGLYPLDEQMNFENIRKKEIEPITKEITLFDLEI